MTVSLLAWLAAGCAIISARARQGGQLSGLHRLAGLLFLATLVQVVEQKEAQWIDV